MNYKCEKCGSVCNLHKHHLFSNSKVNRLNYGKAIDDPKNIMILCYSCHITPKDKLPKMTENEFCQKLQIEPQSKTAKFQAMLDQQKLPF